MSDVAGTRPRLVRTLEVVEHPEGRHAHVASGSGLARHGTQAYVAIDDELHLGVFDLSTAAPVELVRVFPGSLPAEHGARKAHKPDIEAVLVAALDDGPSVIGLPSGSTERRYAGFVQDLLPDGALAARPARRLDCAPLLAALTDAIDGELNLEGAAFVGDELVLALRGTGGRNHLAWLDASAFRRGVTSGSLDAGMVRRVAPVRLGELDGVALGLTDLAAIDGRLYWSACAEATDNAYDDGEIIGSAVGVLDAGDVPRVVARLDPSAGKVEGIEVERRADGAVRALLVTDDDDAARASRLFELDLPAR